MPPGGRMGGPMGGQYLTEEEKKNQPKVTPELLKRVFSYLKPYTKQLILVLICIIVSSFFSLLPSILTGKILDDGLLKKDFKALIFYIVLSLAVTLIASLIGVAETYINTWIAQHITFDMRNQMYSHLQKMSQKFFTSNNQGDIITRMTSDIDGVKAVVTNTFSSILSNSITLIIAMIAMFQKNWILALVGIVIVPIFTVPTRKAGKQRWKLTNESQQVNDEVNGILNETLSVNGQLLVKLFGKEKYEYDRYEKANRKMIGLNIKESMAGRWFRVVLTTFTSVGPMLIYLAGGILMMKYDSDLTIGDITVLVSLLEPDNETYNTGIVDMSHHYEKMYVIRPQFFIPIITLLVQAARKGLEYKRQLAIAQSRDVDVTNFETKLMEFKSKFGNNVKNAHDRFEDAIKAIDKSIADLQKVKDNLLKSDDHLRLANDKVEDLSIRQLTYKNPTMKEKFEAARNKEDK